MERWGWVSGLAEPVFLVALLVGGGIPLALIPAPAGPAVAGVVALVLLGLNYRVDRSVSKLPIRSGAESVRGQQAVVEEPLDPSGLVRLNGEVWKAVDVGGGRIGRGERVVVVEVHGLQLRVTRSD